MLDLLAALRGGGVFWWLQGRTRGVGRGADATVSQLILHRADVWK